MICPECKVEVRHPCWVGPVGTYNGVPIHACGLCQNGKIFTVKMGPQPVEPVDFITVTIECVDET